ncbi:MAG: s-methyl-5-thioribose-1-phosphate isomerase [Sphaerochaetaceae bacterium]|jgi:methylthioribose-1-phosphate isomerase|nr:s-methyl-5-thioribose-1-phosphate isomerase [Sphaerochaetaceae bacterium]
MERADHDLAFLLKYENVAWYEDGKVRILDRRVYPAQKTFVICQTHQEVAQALKDMVTQSAGPYTAGPMGMALAAWECRSMGPGQQMDYLRQASVHIYSARPTTKSRMQIVTDACLPVAEKALAEGRRADLAIRDHIVEANNRRYDKMAKAAEYLVDMFPKNGKIMTQCFAETILGMMLRVCRQRGNDIKLFCPETRPYFQGARLTATVCYEMGFDTTLITDNMPAFVMANEKIDVFTCAADAICLDGYIFNKVGTSQIAICANHFGIPVFVSGSPDIGHPNHQSVTIEMRGPEFSLQAMGVRTAVQGVKGYYPAFDMTPPHLISGIVTDKGIFSPFDLHRYFADGTSSEFTV